MRVKLYVRDPDVRKERKIIGIRIRVKHELTRETKRYSGNETMVIKTKNDPMTKCQ